MASSTIKNPPRVRTVDVSKNISSISANSGGDVTIAFTYPTGCSEIVAITPFLDQSLNLVSVSIDYFSDSSKEVRLRVWNGRTSAITNFKVSARIACI